MDAEDVWLKGLFKEQNEEVPYDAMMEEVVMVRLQERHAIERERTKSLQYAKRSALVCLLLVGGYFVLQCYEVMQLPHEDHLHLINGILVATVALSMMYIRLVLLKRPAV